MPNSRTEQKVISPAKQTWYRLVHNKLALSGLVIIFFAAIIAILGYLVTPDSTPWANDMVLQIGTKGPGFNAKMLLVKKNRTMEKENIFSTMLNGKDNPYDMIPINSYRFEDQFIVINEYIGEEGFGTEKKLEIADVLYAKSTNKPEVIRTGDMLHFYDINDKKVSRSIKDLQKELEDENFTNKIYLLGTDKFGRDILSRLIIGVRVSLSVGFIAVFISLIIGITLGAAAGYFRGRIDDVIMWFINVIWSIPTLLLVFAITLALGKGFWQIFVAVGLTMWVEVARIIRGQVMAIREIEFVEAARALGFSNWRIVSKHILPNVLGPVFVIAAANFAAAIIVESGLSFLGIGVQPPRPSWGTMMKEHYGYIIANDPFLAIVPGLAIMIMVLAFNLLGNGMRDALDVKTRANF